MAIVIKPYCPRNNPAYRKLERRLLALGGDRALLTQDAYLDALLRQGREFPAAGARKIKGEVSRCHHNAALHYLNRQHFGPDGCVLVAGYALNLGAWRQHSWVWDGKRVLESTVLAKGYFGVALNPDEAAQFVLEVVANVLPEAAAYLNYDGGIHACGAPGGEKRFAA
jgi:hypothetical protein